MTKLLPSLLLVLAFVAQAASAGSFPLAQAQQGSTILRLGTVVAEDRGTLEVYDFRTADQGQLLGTEALQAGANADVQVNLRHAPFGDVLAVLRVDGEVTARQVIRISEPR